MRSKFKWIFTLLVAFTMQFSFAQEKTVTGVVSDELGPIAGANVVVEGTTRGTTTDFDGKFTIKTKQGEVLVISYTGKKTSKVTIGAPGAYNVSLKDEAITGKEIVVEGYRSTTKATTIIAQTTVGAETIENRPNASFVQTLQGQVAGLSISSGSGQPGARSKVLIRGVSSLTGSSDPLYVIDGMPSNGDNFRSLNPADIESATILKDASALAVYGNRASAGVIIVKTKRGGTSDAKTSFRYTTSTGIAQLQDSKYDFANSRQMLDLEIARFGSVNVDPFTGLDYTDDVNFDWTNYFFRRGITTDHQFSITTSGKNLRSFTSVGYARQQGVLEATGLSRFSFRNNIDGMSNNEKFKYSTSAFVGFSKTNEATNLGTGNINQNYVNGAFLSLPYLTPDSYQGSQWTFDYYNNTPGLMATPFMLVDKLRTFGNQTDELRVLANAELSYKLFKDVTLVSRTGAELLESRLLQWQHPISFNSFLFLNPGQQFGGTEAINHRRDFGFNQLFQLNYLKKFREKHTFNALLNMEYNLNQLNANNTTQRGLDPRTFVPGAGTGYLADIAAHDFYGPVTSASQLKLNLISYFGIFDYDFDNRFGLSASYRFDGASRFADNYNWGEFWSVGGRWNIDNEAFLKDSNFVKVLKLRASYGGTGNQRVVAGTQYAGLLPPAFADTYAVSATQANTYNGQPVYNINFGANDLQWETTYQSNFGLDFELLNSGRLRGNVDVYSRLTDKLLNSDPVSPVTGTTAVIRNSSIELENKGVELSLAYDLVKNDNFTFTVRGNGAYNKTNISGIPGNGQIFNADGVSINQNGGQFSEFFLIPYAGVNPATGNLLFVAADGSLTETPSVDTDRRATGKTLNPIYQGGFGFDADYKGFFVSTTFTYAMDVWRMDYDLESLYDPGNIGQFVASPDLLNAWTPTNTNTSVPSLTAVNAGFDDNSDRFLKDASYVRLRNLQVGYRVPQKFLEKTFISDLSFTLQGENLVTFTKWQGFDAESTRTNDYAEYPTPKIFTFGLDLKF